MEDKKQRNSLAGIFAPVYFSDATHRREAVTGLTLLAELSSSAQWTLAGVAIREWDARGAVGAGGRRDVFGITERNPF